MLIHPQTKLIREPRLMVPGQKPVGPVRLDTRHPLSQYIANYYPGLPGSPFHGFVGRNFVAGTVTGTVTPTVVGGEPAVYSANNATTNKIWFPGEAPGLSNFLFVGRSRSDGAGSSTNMFGNYDGSVGWRFRTGTSALDPQFLTAPAPAIIITTPTGVDGTFTYYCYRVGSSATGGIFELGEYITDTTANSDITIGGMCILNTGETQSTSSKGWAIFSMLLIGLPNPAAVYADICRNPYQFLIPA